MLTFHDGYYYIFVNFQTLNLVLEYLIEKNILFFNDDDYVSRNLLINIFELRNYEIGKLLDSKGDILEKLFALCPLNVVEVTKFIEKCKKYNLLFKILREHVV